MYLVIKVVILRHSKYW